MTPRQRAYALMVWSWAEHDYYRHRFMACGYCAYPLFLLATHRLEYAAMVYSEAVDAEKIKKGGL